MIEMYLGMFSGGWAIDGRTQGWSSHTEPSRALEAWAQEIERKKAGRWRKASVSLWLSGGLARPFLCGPMDGLKTWGEADAMATAVAPDATGFAAPCRVRLEEWPGDVAALGSAIEASFAQTIEDVARGRRVVWRSVRPRWALLLDEVLGQRPSTGLLAFEEEDALTLLGGSSRHPPETAPAAFELATTYAPAPTGDQATALWHRAMLSRDVRPEDAWFARMTPPSMADTESLADGTSRVPRWPDAVRHAEAALT